MAEAIPTLNIKWPKSRNTTASFAGLANSSTGAELIGCLKMDVDNLGRIFSEYLIDFDLSSLAHLSKMLNIFFNVYITKICSGDLGKDESGNFVEPIDITGKKYTHEAISNELSKRRGAKGRNVSVIYSGGDDLFIVGAWDEVVELSYDIQRCFAKFSGMGISGGLTLHKAKIPLYQMAKLSKEAEREAKSFKLESELKPSKNRIVLFYSPFHKHKSKSLNNEAINDLKKGISNYQDKLIYALKWTDKTSIEIVEKVISFCEKKNNRLEFKNISRGFLYKLFCIAEVWWETETLYIPELTYLIGRIIKNLEDDYRVKFIELRDKIIKMPVQNNKHQTIRFIKIPLTWIDLLQRSKGE